MSTLYPLQPLLTDWADVAQDGDVIVVQPAGAILTIGYTEAHAEFGATLNGEDDLLLPRRTQLEDLGWGWLPSGAWIVVLENRGVDATWRQFGQFTEMILSTLRMLGVTTFAELTIEAASESSGSESVVYRFVEELDDPLR